MDVTIKCDSCCDSCVHFYNFFHQKNPDSVVSLIFWTYWELSNDVSGLKVLTPCFSNFWVTVLLYFNHAITYQDIRYQMWSHSPNPQMSCTWDPPTHSPVQIWPDTARLSLSQLGSACTWNSHNCTWRPGWIQTAPENMIQWSDWRLKCYINQHKSFWITSRVLIDKSDLSLFCA